MIKELAISLSIGVISVLFLAGIGYWSYFFIKKIYPYPLSSLKYGIFKRKHKKEDVKWCVDAIDQGYTENKVLTFLLLKGYKIKKAKARAYLLRQCSKKLKGGIKNE